MWYQAAIRRTLWTGGVLSLVLAVIALCWAWLAGLGDVAGAEGVRGAACVAAFCWALNFVTLVVLLALVELARQGAASRGEPVEKS